MENKIYLNKLNEIKDIYIGRDAIVFGCGTSVRLFDKYKKSRPKNLLILGVNDIGEYITPDYHCIFDGPEAFTPERLNTVVETNAPLITDRYIDWDKLGKDVIAVNLNGRGVWHEFDNDNTIPYGIVSPYTAIVCAYYLGCRRIGMLGVDFTPNHYNRKDGDHNQTYRLEKINEEFSCLESDLFVRRCTLVNLSPDSEIHSVTKMDIEDFLKI
jgi:hypothetical protein